MKTHSKASSTGSSRGRASLSQALPAEINLRSFALGGLLLALVFAQAFAASTAHATFVQTDSWTVAGEPALRGGSFGIAKDTATGDLFTGMAPLDHQGTGEPHGQIDRWDPSVLGGNLLGTFGSTFSTDPTYSGVAIDATTHNVYALVNATSDELTTGEPKIAVFQPDGTSLGSFPVSTSENVGIDVDSSGHVFVPDPAGAVVNEYDGVVGSGTFGELLDTTSGGTLHHPIDVSLDSSGDLYVADQSSSRQDEEQQVDLGGNEGGSFRVSYEGEHTGISFTGDIDFVQGTGDITVAHGTGDRSLLASFTGDLHKGSTAVENVSGVSGIVSVGASVSVAGDTQAQSIPFGTTIAGCVPDCANPTELTLSKPAGSAASGNSGLGNTFNSGSKVLTNVTNAADFKVGMGIVGAPGNQGVSGIPFRGGSAKQPGYVDMVTAVDTANNAITLADGVTEAGTGTSVDGEYITDAQATSGAFVADEKLSGPFGNGLFSARITSVSTDGHTFVASDPSSPASSTDDSPISGIGHAIKNIRNIDGRFSPNLRLYGTGVPAGTTLLSGRPVQGPPETVSNTVGWSYSERFLSIDAGSAFQFSKPFTQGGTGIDFHADLQALSGVPFGTISNGDEYQSALEALPTVAAATNFGLDNDSKAETDSIQTDGSGGVTFHNAMGGRDLSQMSCESVAADPLTGGTGSCSVTTTQDGSNVPGRVAKFDPSLAWTGDFIPPTTDYSADAVEVDKSTGDVYVGGGNGDWDNPQGMLSGPDAPNFTVKRYDSSGSELETIGAGRLTPRTYSIATTETPPVRAFGLAYDSASDTLYTVGRPTDLTYTTLGSVVRAFSVGHTLTVDATGVGSGTIDADHGAIAACDPTGGGVCSDDYVDGDTVTLHATPDALSEFEGWNVVGDPGADCSDPSGDCTVTINADVTVHATFKHGKFGVDVVRDGGGTGEVSSTPAGIDCGATCSALFEASSDVTLHATATGPSAFVGWTVDGDAASCTDPGSDCTVTIDAAKTVHAKFTQPQPLTIVKEGTGTGTVTSTPSGIDCGTTCGPVTFPEASDVTLHAAPDPHQTFDGWSGGGCTGTADCLVTMGAATTVHATFTQITHSVSVSKNGTGAGTVTAASGAINCGATCTGSYGEGVPVVLTANPAPHSQFTAWSGCVSTSGNQCTVNVDAAENVTATYDLIERTLGVTVNGTGAGKVDADSGAIANCAKASGVCADSAVVDGTPITLTASPDPHSTVAWSGDCDQVSGDTCTLTVDGGKAITATFTLRKYSLAIARTGTGTGSVACDGGACASSYDYGTAVTLSAAVAPGSHFAGWTGACSGSGSCIVTLDGDKSVSAAFVADPPALPPPSCATDPSLCPAKGKQLKCRKGFKKKTIKGKARCVKTHKKHRKHHGR